MGDMDEIEGNARFKLAERLSRIVTHTEHGDDVRVGPYVADQIADAIAEYTLALLQSLPGRQ